jgi:hypothetical protein
VIAIELKLLAGTGIVGKQPCLFTETHTPLWNSKAYLVGIISLRPDDDTCKVDLLSVKWRRKKSFNG